MNLQQNQAAIVLKAGALVVAFLLLAACGTQATHISQKSSDTGAGQLPTSKQPTSQNQLTVDKAGLSGAVASGYQFWQAGALLTNHDKAQQAISTAVAATAYDASGQVVGTGNQVVNVIQPGQTLPVSVQLNVTAPPAKVNVLASARQWAKPGDSAVAGVGATFNNAPGTLVGTYQNSSPDSTGSELTVNANLTSTYAMDLQSVTVYAVGLDQMGDVVWAGFGGVPLVPAHGSVGVQINSYGLPPNIATWQIAGVP